MNGVHTIKNINTCMEYIFFSNYFYGICAVALAVEATWQQHLPVDHFVYLIFIFLITVLYYAYPYIRKTLARSKNPRTNWYTRHYNLMWWNQVIISLFLACSAFLFLEQYKNALLHLSSPSWILLFVFPVVASAYYGANFLFGKYNLRTIGWLKPFIIGFTWAGLVTVYPVLFHDIINHRDYDFNWIAALLFLKNFMFISVLCIMFDIKDYAADYMAKLKTFVVNLGLRRTIFYILFPLSVLGLATFIFYAEAHGFPRGRVLLNTVPFVLLIIVCWSLRKRRSLLYYMSIVDGLMLVKAICGCIAIKCF
jgi:hypothetical protein